MNGLAHVGHVAITPRPGLDGALDRMALVDAAADAAALDRRIQELALRVCRGCGSGADEQVAAVEAYVVGLPYRREPADVLRPVTQTATDGGDCDDLTLLCLAMLRALSLPCTPQLMATADGNGFHIRAAVYLPPLNPSHLYPIDPVRFSEAEWALVNVPPEQWKLDQRRLQRLAGDPEFAGLLR